MIRKIISVWLSFILCITGFIALCSISEPITLVEKAVTDINLFINEDGNQTDTEIPEGLSSEEWDDIQTELQKARYYPTWHESIGGYVASNPRHGWGITFDKGAAEVSPASDEDWSWLLIPSGYGYGDNVFPLNANSEATVNENRVEFSYDVGLVAWYINNEYGLEHGFNIATPPQPRTEGNLVIEMSLNTPLVPKEINNGRNIVFSEKSGEDVLTYDKLFVTDATGRSLPSSLHLSMDFNTITIHMDDTNAMYPLIVDPLITNEDVKLTASDGAAYDYLGNSVSISGENVVVGAAYDDIGANENQGSVYIFARNQGGTDKWGEVVKLTASDGDANDSFGYSVFLAGDRLVVGAPGDSTFVILGHGSVYIFERNHGGPDNWGEVVKITAQDGLTGDYFGNFVSIDGNTLVVGANNDDIGAFVDQGSAYIFDRDQGGSDNWGEVVKITASDGEGVDHFGNSVSVSNDTVVVGAWADDVGANDTQGSAYVFKRNQGGSDNWGEVTKLTASDGEPGDGFGASVSIAGDTVIVGAPGHDIGATIAQGSVYVFERNQGGADNWGEVVKIIASDGASADFFGNFVYINDDTIAVGADYDDIDLNDTQGSAYVFKRNQGGSNNWGEVTKLTASDGEADDHFGRSVCVSGDIVVVGAPFDNVSANIRQGSAYIYHLNYTNNLPSITTADIITAYEDSLFLNDYDANDPDEDTLTWSLWTDTSGWLAIDSASGILSGTPINSDVGSWTVNVSVSDGNGGIDFSNFSLTVMNTNDAPVIITGNVDTAIVDEFYRVDYNATDDDADTLNWALNTDASWLNFDIVNGVLYGTPGNSEVGYYLINISVTDSNNGYDFIEFTLNVMNTNNAPSIDTNNIGSAIEGALYYVDYEATDEDLDDVLSWALDTNAGWLNIDQSSGILSGTPYKNDVGSFSVKVSVSDGNGGSDFTEFTLEVLADSDLDGIPDSEDIDKDNDGYNNDEDDFPLDGTEWLDTDNDGIGDNADDDDDDDEIDDDEDDFPLDPAASIDTDDDGKPDQWNEGYDEDDSTTGLVVDDDDDGDGVLDGDDKYPLDPSMSDDAGEEETTDWIPYIILIVIVVLIIIILAAASKGGKKSGAQVAPLEFSETTETVGVVETAAAIETQTLKCPECQNTFEASISDTTIQCPHCGYSSDVG